MRRIDTRGMHYEKLNKLIYQTINAGENRIILNNVRGQRYIGAALSDNIRITINGVPGNDLAVYMNGPTIIVNSNGQDGVGNTMNAGKIVINGDVGDIVGHSMRGGKIYIRGNTGYRAGIHMKSYKELYPVIIIGGNTEDFLGEYIAGGIIIVLGLGKRENGSAVGNYVGTGMHGGTIYIRSKVEKYQLGKEAMVVGLNKEDIRILRSYLSEYCRVFSLDLNKITKENFVKLVPHTNRPFKKIYAY
jgi:glutamate synthase domain-containing protein 3